eukprot:scaffold230927_cov18-Prasinocladus_malaysianus.AAC.1
MFAFACVRPNPVIFCWCRLPELCLAPQLTTLPFAVWRQAQKSADPIDVRPVLLDFVVLAAY